MLKGTLHQLLRVRDHWNQKNLISGKGKTVPLHFDTRAWGPKKPRKFKMDEQTYMESYIAWIEYYFTVYQVLRQAHHKEVGLTTYSVENPLSLHYT